VGIITAVIFAEILSKLLVISEMSDPLSAKWAEQHVMPEDRVARGVIAQTDILSHRRSLVFRFGGLTHGEREPIMGVWGLCPQRGPGADPLVGGQGAKPP